MADFEQAELAKQLGDDRERLASSVYTVFTDLGGCVRCSMRYLCLHQVQLFNLTEEQLVQFFHTFVSDTLKLDYPKPESFCCRICLGVLQDNGNKEFVFKEQILRSIAECGYQYDNFQFCINLPHTILIRELALLKQLQRDAPGLYNNIASIPSVKEVFKWIHSLLMPIQFKKESAFMISLLFSHAESEKELSYFTPMKTKLGRKNRWKKAANILPAVQYSIPSLTKQMEEMSIESLQAINLLPLPPVTTICQLIVKFEYGHVYVAGRYNKFSRELSQTPWVIDGKRKGDSSVEELIGDIIIKAYEATGYSFSSAGREDIDVRMLGTGRPFILEIQNPKKAFQTQTQITAMQRAINENATSRIFIRDLQAVDKKGCDNLKQGEEHKRKTYRCVVTLTKNLTQDDFDVLDKLSQHEFEIDQNTPIRVLHRRTLSSRKKMIYKLSYEVINPSFLLVDLETQAGTYIKEFIHGDFGRTTPNLGSILNCEADILQLDVQSIVFDWPPTLAED